MKFILILLILLKIFIGISQTNNDSTIYFKPVFVNQCTGEVVKDNYTVREINEFSTISNRTSENNLLSLPHYGNYSLITENIGEYEFEITKPGLYIDTFFISRLFQIYEYRFEYCGYVTEGRIKNYFPNGNLSFKGNFHSGSLVDSVINYYCSGEIKMRKIKEKNNTISVYKYYKNGNLKEYNDTESAELIKYYGNGSLKETHFFKSRKWFFKGYYPNGEIQNNSNNNKELFFFENGQIKEKLIYKEIWRDYLGKLLNPRKNGFFVDRLYNVRWKSFNENGTLKREIFFTYYSLFLNIKENIDALNSKEFNILFYKNGKKYKLIEYDYTKKAHNLYEYIKHKKVLISTIEENKVKELINQIDKEIE